MRPRPRRRRPSARRGSLPSPRTRKAFGMTVGTRSLDCFAAVGELRARVSKSSREVKGGSVLKSRAGVQDLLAPKPRAALLGTSPRATTLATPSADPHEAPHRACAHASERPFLPRSPAGMARSQQTARASPGGMCVLSHVLARGVRTLSLTAPRLSRPGRRASSWEPRRRACARAPPSASASARSARVELLTVSSFCRWRPSTLRRASCAQITLCKAASAWRRLGSLFPPPLLAYLGV